MTVAENIETVDTKRKLHFAIVDVNFRVEFQSGQPNRLKSFMDLINRLSVVRGSNRYQAFNGRILFVSEFYFDVTNNFISGKLLSIREDIFPQLINFSTGVLTDIDGDDDQAIAETTHFVIDYTTDSIKACLEYNISGGKLADFENYFGIMGLLLGATHSFNCSLLATDSDLFPDFGSATANISEFTVKVLNENFSQISSIDTGLATALQGAARVYNPKYLEMKMRFNYRDSTYPALKESIRNVQQVFREDRNARKVFKAFQIRAENPQHNGKMELFDFLIEKLKTEVTVKKRKRAKTIVSDIIIPIMKQQLIRIRS